MTLAAASLALPLTLGDPMLSPRLQPLFTVSAAPETGRYFEHRAATGRTAEMLVGAELNILWSNAAGLALLARRDPVSLAEDRLILSQRLQEDSLRAFLADLNEQPGVWALQAQTGWLVRAEPITPADAPPAWLLTWQAMGPADRYLWADVGAHLHLTPAETRVLLRLLEGSTIEHAADSLFISIQTARTHVRRIYAKLGVKCREQLFAVALPYRWG